MNSRSRGWAICMAAGRVCVGQGVPAASRRALSGLAADRDARRDSRKAGRLPDSSGGRKRRRRRYREAAALDPDYRSPRTARVDASLRDAIPAAECPIDAYRDCP